MGVRKREKEKLVFYVPLRLSASPQHFFPFFSFTYLRFYFFYFVAI